MTKAEVITVFQRACPDGANHASEYFDQAYRELLLRVPALSRTSKTISLTAGTAAYDLPGELLEALSVVYATDDSGAASSYVGNVLVERSLPESTAVYGSGLLSRSSGTPSSYCIRAVDQAASASVEDAKWQIVLDPVPSVSTSSGFPILVIEGTFYAAISSTSHLLASGIPGPDILVSLMKRSYARDYDQAQMAAHDAAAAQMMGRLESEIAQRQRGERVTLLPEWLAPGQSGFYGRR